MIAERPLPQIDLEQLHKRGPLLGLDPGSKTLGIAACDAMRMIASPVETIPRGKKLAPSLRRFYEIYDEYKAVGVVIGLPLNMDGSAGPRTQAAKALAFNIQQMRDIPIVWQDERMTSAQAERVMLDADLSRARRAELIDASAAAIILQTAIDRLANAG